MSALQKRIGRGKRRRKRKSSGVKPLLHKNPRARPAGAPAAQDPHYKKGSDRRSGHHEEDETLAPSRVVAGEVLEIGARLDDEEVELA